MIVITNKDISFWKAGFGEELKKNEILIIIEIKELNKDYKKNLHSTTFNIIMREQGPSQHGATKQIRDDRPV